MLPVGMKADAVDVARVAGKLVYEFSIVQIPDFNQQVVAACGQATAVRTHSHETG